MLVPVRSPALGTALWASSPALPCPLQGTPWRQKEPQLGLRRGPTTNPPGPKENRASVRTVKIHLEVWGLFVCLFFQSFCYRCFPAATLVHSCTNHLWAVTVTTQVFLHLEAMFSLFFESCPVGTAWSTLEGTLGEKKSLLPVSFPSLFAVTLDYVFQKLDLAQGHNVLFFFFFVLAG